MKQDYQFFIEKYARSVAETEEGYLKILRATTKDYPPISKIVELPEKISKKYMDYRSDLMKIRKGRKKSDLQGAELERYDNIRAKQHEILKENWVKNLPEGEQKAFDILSRQIKDYLPHIFETEDLIAAFTEEISIINNKLKTATDPGAITQYKNRLRKLEESTTKLKGGGMITYESLPSNVRFRFFETRQGKAGYSFDAMKAYETYLAGIAKKIYYEPMLKKVGELHKQLNPNMRDYNKWYIRDFMGWNKSPFDDLAGMIASFQWMRTLGLNPRSAIVNLTQRLNTVAEVGVEHSIRGEKFAFTKEGKRLFDDTGIAREVPTVLLEGPVPEGMEKIRATVGFMFNKVEIGNRRHAFLSAVLKARDGKVGKQSAKRFGIPDPKNMTEAQIIQYGIDVVHRTQFRYGKVGMPKMLRTPAGRLAFQFWSFPIKQVELMTRWARYNPSKLIKWIAMAEGGNIAVKKVLDEDLSNALGFGITWGEALEAMKSIPENDWRGFYRHMRLAFSGGGGMLPSGLGPTATGAIKVADAFTRGKGWKAIKKEITPIQFKRMSAAYKAVMNKQGDLYPIYDSNKHLMYYITAKELTERTFGPRPARESELYVEWQRKRLFQDEYKELVQDAVNAIVDGNDKEFDSLVDKYGVVPTDEQILAEIQRRELSQQERESLKSIGKKERYRLERE